jgi:hypothetical protein
MAGPGLPVNIDATYADAGDASVPIHQQHHDTGHTTLNAIDKDTLPPTPVMLAGVIANNQTGTTYTLVLADAGKVVELNNAGVVTLTIPTNAALPGFPVGTVIELWQQGLGQVTVGGAGVTIRAPAGKSHIAAQYGSATLRKRATDEWCLEGDIS